MKTQHVDSRASIRNAVSLFRHITASLRVRTIRPALLPAMMAAIAIGAWMLCPAPASAATPPVVPDILKPWIPWVLHNQEHLLDGIPDYNNAGRLQMAWPTSLKLDVHAGGGTFVQDWFVAGESWALLPGGDPPWPRDVRVDGAPAIITRRAGRPAVKLLKGTHRISGMLSWNKLPEHLPVPVDTALIEMTVNGAISPFPRLDGEGRLWFQVQRPVEEKVENRLTIQSFRLITDEIPAVVSYFLKLDVSGNAREVMLGPAFDKETFVPVSLNSDLPARIEPDGRLAVQLRPGQWTLRFAVRHIGALQSLTFNRPDDGFWPDQSVWSFQSRNHMRIVELDGLPSIDPQQTSLPDEWRGFPAYRVLPGETLTFREIKRGDAEPAPDQLELKRTMWLRFDGSGYTLQDRITGSKNNDWRLEMQTPLQLGKVEVDGVIQFITQREGSSMPGIEIRRGAVDLTADSEIAGGVSRIPLTGWDQMFQKVSTNLILPPGYRLVHAFGIDNVPDTWINRWKLLDMFFLLLFTVAASKLYSKKTALLAFVTLGLLVHEPGAPMWSWLAVLIGAALLKYLPAGWFRRIVAGYQIAAVLALIIISVMFATRHIRHALYPQLERSYGLFQGPGVETKADMAQEMAPTEPEFSSFGMQGGITGAGNVRRKSNVAQYDPRMLNQTGPGLPNWNWRSIRMESGPSEPGRQLMLILTGPVINGILAFARVGLLVLLAFGLFGIRYGKGTGWSTSGLRSMFVFTWLPVALLVSLLAAATFGGLLTPCVQASEIPSQQVLDELRNRLLQRDDCFPDCASVIGMDIRITPDELNIIMQVQSRIDAAVPLPGNGAHWLPVRAVLDGEPVRALIRRDNTLWTMVPAGVHELEISGRLPVFNTIQLPLPMKPGSVSVKADGWTVEGVRENGFIDNQLQFSRIVSGQQDAGTGLQDLGTNVLPVFAHVTRTLLLGLDWRVETSVRRVSPVNAAILLEIPLLAGESVLTETVEVKDGMARINLDASANEIVWESMLEPTDTITLMHAPTNLWTETWQVDISPILHLEYSGIPVVMQQQEARWFPQWHPWPGEELELQISRPAGVQGQTLTIQKSYLQVTPGKRVSDCSLAVTLQSSQGIQHTIGLPEGAQVHEILIDQLAQPIRLEGRGVPLTITPGTHEISIKWRENRGISAIYRTPDIDLGIRHVNASIEVRYPPNRWLLWLWGPRLGPAVLFWPFLFVIVLAAFLLSRTGMTPLKFRHWLLMGLGMTQGGLSLILIIVGWLLIMHLRRKVKPDLQAGVFNLMQVAIVILSGIAMAAMIAAIGQGLLGSPDMSITGNSSYNNSHQSILNWYQDSSGPVLPVAGILSIPVFFYRLAMLLWALWIAFYMIHILKWVWECFSKPVFWQPSYPRVRKPLHPGPPPLDGKVN